MAIRHALRNLAPKYASDATHRMTSVIRKYAAVEAEIASPVPTAT
jgi:hypothetical protein